MTINNEDLIALQRYVTGKDSYDAVSPGTIVLDITHSNLKQRHLQIRFNLRDTIDNVRDRIYRQTGTHAPFQYLYFIDCGVTLFEIPPEEESTKMLDTLTCNMVLQFMLLIWILILDREMERTKIRI